MRGFRDADVGHAVEDALERDAAFGAAERRARTGVDAVSERKVLASVGAVDQELVRLLERRGSRLTAPGRTMTVLPAGMSTPPIVAATRVSRN